MGEFLFDIGDKVNIKYYEKKGLNKTSFKIINRTILLDGENSINGVNVYVIESIGISPTQEKYIDEIYLKYEKAYLRKLKLKEILNGQLS